jgi:hypothetical protein
MPLSPTMNLSPSGRAGQSPAIARVFKENCALQDSSDSAPAGAADLATIGTPEPADHDASSLRTMTLTLNFLRTQSSTTQALIFLARASLVSLAVPRTLLRRIEDEFGRLKPQKSVTHVPD